MLEKYTLKFGGVVYSDHCELFCTDMKMLSQECKSHCHELSKVIQSLQSEWINKNMCGNFNEGVMKRSSGKFVQTIWQSFLPQGKV